MTQIQIYTDGSFNPDYKMYAGVPGNVTVDKLAYNALQEGFERDSAFARKTVF